MGFKSSFLSAEQVILMDLVLHQHFKKDCLSKSYICQILWLLLYVQRWKKFIKVWIRKKSRTSLPVVTLPFSIDINAHVSLGPHIEKVFWQNIIENKIFCQFRKFLQNVEKENSLLLSKHYQNVMCITGNLLRGLGFQDRKKSQPFYNQADTTHCIYILKKNNN